MSTLSVDREIGCADCGAWVNFTDECVSVGSMQRTSIWARRTTNEDFAGRS
jgi:hypothetical protein